MIKLEVRENDSNFVINKYITLLTLLDLQLITEKLPRPTESTNKLFRNQDIQTYILSGI